MKHNELTAFFRTTISRSIVFIILFLVTFAVTHAADTSGYVPLAGLPGVTDTTSNPNLTSYLNALFLVSISLGGLLAVVKIAIAGFKYMLTEQIGAKGEARDDIKGALFGLAILVSAFIVLNTIDPQFTNLNVLRSAESIDLPTQSVTSKGTGSKAGEGVTACKTGEEYVLTSTGGGCAPVGAGGTGGTSLCPTGYKETSGVKIVVGGGGKPAGWCESVPGSKNYYSCMPKTACPSGTKLKNTPGTCIEECKAITKGDFLWGSIADTDAELAQQKVKCTNDGGVLKFSNAPAGEIGYDTSCIAK